MSVVACLGEPLVVMSAPRGTDVAGTDVLELSEGGAELNVAIHLARLGHETRMVGGVGDDVLGVRLRRRLGAEGVDDRWLVTVPDAPTGVYVKERTASGGRMLYLRRGAATSTMRAVPAGALEGVVHVHLTGITPALSPGCAELVDGVLADGAGPDGGHRRDGGGPRVSFDINHRPALWAGSDAPQTLLRLARRADTVFVGLDEAEGLWGCTSPEEVRALLPDVDELVVKDSDRPATAYRGAVRVSRPAVAGHVVDVVGAGDAFAAGYLHARLGGQGPDAALHAGHVLAAAVLASHDDLGAPVSAGLLVDTTRRSAR